MVEKEEKNIKEKENKEVKGGDEIKKSSIAKNDAVGKKVSAGVGNNRYIESVGRRKTAIARVRIWPHSQREFLINGKPVGVYFSQPELQRIAMESLEKMKTTNKFKVSVLVRGGGLHSQATAVRHSVARALVNFNPDFRKRLKRAGFLTRDPRMRERKKFGLKRARRAPQWQKR